MNDKYNLNNMGNNRIDIEDRLESLKKIKQVDSPPYLFTRIKANIYSLNNVRAEAPAQWKWTFAITAIAIIVLNISIMLNNNSSENMTEGIENVVNSMHLSNNNDFYQSNEN